MYQTSRGYTPLRRIMTSHCNLSVRIYIDLCPLIRTERHFFFTYFSVASLLHYLKFPYLLYSTDQARFTERSGFVFYGTVRVTMCYREPLSPRVGLRLPGMRVRRSWSGRPGQNIQRESVQKVAQSEIRACLHCSKETQRVKPRANTRNRPNQPSMLLCNQIENSLDRS